MWLRIKAEGGPNLSLPLPLCLLKSRLLWSIIEKHADEQIAQYQPIAREVLGELSSYVRTYGHFVLLDVESANGEKVRITI